MSSQSSSNVIFKISFLTSSLLFFLGTILITIDLGLSAVYIVLGLIAVSVGAVQIIVDLGWMAILRANQPTEIHNWHEALNYVAKVKGQRIFIFPVIFDILLISASSFLLLGLTL